MPEYLLAAVSQRTFDDMFRSLDGPELAIRHAPSAGDALAILAQDADCRLAVVERELEPPIGRFVQRLRREKPDLEILLLTAAVSDAVRHELQALGVDLLDRALPPADLALTVARRFRRASLQARAGIVGRSPRLHEILETILQVGPTDIPVLVTGPSGAGKELVARAVMLASRRAERPFVALNVGALAESVLESELFGHEKGAFTGAVTRKAGVFESADGGTLFLDEVGEMTPHMQVRLLRVLDRGEVTPVGSAQALQVDVRLVAATNRDLEEAVRRGAFREDLYYRLKVVHLEVPPLAARRDDIPLLVHHLLEESAHQHGTHVRRVADEAMRLLVAYDWPGNVRELRNVVQAMAVRANGATIEAADVPAAVREGRIDTLPVALHRSTDQAERDIILHSLLALRRDIGEVLDILRREQRPPARAMVVEPNAESLDAEPQKLRDNERDLIAQALAAAGGNRRLAAERLGIAERTLYRKLRAFGLS